MQTRTQRAIASLLSSAAIAATGATLHSVGSPWYGYLALIVAGVASWADGRLSIEEKSE